MFSQCVQKQERVHDCASDRSASLSALKAAPDDTIQVCVVENGTPGWWGRITIKQQEVTNDTRSRSGS